MSKKFNNTGELFLVKYSNVFIIMGYNRSFILDSLRMNYFYIPNDLVIFIDDYNKKRIDKNTGEEYSEYISFLLENELAFLCNGSETNLFPDFKEQWDYESPISNAVIEIDYKNLNFFLHRFNIINQLGCTNFLMFSQKSIGENAISTLLKGMSGALVDSLDLYLPYSVGLVNMGKKLLKEHPFIRVILLFSSHSNEYVVSYGNRTGNLITTINDFKLDEHKKSFSSFNLTLTHYLESKKNNTFFNRKIFVNLEGKILNSIQSKNSFGNIDIIKNHIQLKKIIDLKSFKKFWEIDKEKCDVCNVCEYRRVCIDTRIPIKRGKDYYFEVECNYNPFISKWSNEDGYKNLENCGVVSSDIEYSIDEQVVKKINNRLWIN